MQSFTLPTLHMVGFVGGILTCFHNWVTHTIYGIATQAPLGGLFAALYLQWWGLWISFERMAHGLPPSSLISTGVLLPMSVPKINFIRLPSRVYVSTGVCICVLSIEMSCSSSALAQYLRINIATQAQCACLFIQWDEDYTIVKLLNVYRNSLPKISSNEW